MKNFCLAGLLTCATGITLISAIAQQATALPQTFWQHSHSVWISQGLTPPFALDGKPVYVSTSGTWREARLTGYNWNSQTGFRYSVFYTNNNQTELNVAASRIISLSTAQARGIATTVYNLSTQAGVSQMLNAHNSWRRRYGVPALTWSPQLATYAQQWANTLLQNGRFEHRRNSPYGENLAAASGQQFSPERVVKMWGDEVANYKYSSNSCAPGKVCGHFTQIVWKDTKQVGCGMARNAQREVWVCNYNPPGNIIGRRPY